MRSGNKTVQTSKVLQYWRKTAWVQIIERFYVGLQTGTFIRDFP